MSEIIRHNCGLCVTHTLHDAYSLIRSLQHRGREATGMAAVGNGRIDIIKWTGPVNRFDITDLHKIFPASDYHSYMAHVRYATRGRKDQILEDAHPHCIGGEVEDHGSHMLVRDCDMAIVHNGQVSGEYLDGEYNCDTEALLHYYRKHGEKSLMENIPGAYTMAIADKEKEGIIVLRDRTGIKPGVLGWKDGKYGVASEDIAFIKNGGNFVEDLEPGSIYYMEPDGTFSKEQVERPNKKYCFFEWNYLADMSSMLNGVGVRRLRGELGEKLAQEFNADNIDLVTFLPRSPEIAARSFANALGLSFKPVFYKMRGERSFQGSTSGQRKDSISQNLHLLPGKKELEGKRIITIDDSIVRGNNSRWERQLLYEEANVKEAIHLNYSPPIGIIGEDGKPRGCLFGVDMPPDDDFIARNRTVEEISHEMEMPVSYISVDGMLSVFEKLGIKRQDLCYYCIGGPSPF